MHEDGFKIKNLLANNLFQQIFGMLILSIKTVT